MKSTWVASLFSVNAICARTAAVTWSFLVSTVLSAKD
jgi:hypothetical protein